MEKTYFEYKKDEYKLFTILFSCNNKDQLSCCWEYYNLFLKKWNINNFINNSLQTCKISFIKNFNEVIDKLNNL